MTDNLIKITVQEDNLREHLWAEKLEDNLAIIRNIPFLSKNITYQDLVRFCPETGTVLKIVNPSGLKSGYVAYHGNQKEYSILQKTLSKEGIHTEGIVGGICSIAYPKYMKLDILDKIVNEANGMLISQEEVKMAIRHAGSTKGCACCGKKLES